MLLPAYAATIHTPCCWPFRPLIAWETPRGGADARGKRSDIDSGRLGQHKAAPRTRGSMCGDAQ